MSAGRVGKPGAGWLRRARERAGRVRRARRRAGKAVRPWREDRAEIVEDRRIERLGAEDLVEQHRRLIRLHRHARRVIERLQRSNAALQAALRAAQQQRS